MKKPGVYKITNNINGKCYIGKSESNVEGRLEQHRNNYQSNQHLQNSIRKYGLINFSFEVLEYCKREDCWKRERYWIEYYDSMNPEKGFNKTNGGEYKPGIQFSKDTRRKMSENNAMHNPESRARLSESMKGNKNFQGHRHSEETKKKISEKVSGENHGMYGKHHSEEAKRKIGEASRNLVRTEEHRKNISKALKGKRKGYIVISNGEIKKSIHRDELDKYLSEGWEISGPNKGKIQMSNDNNKTYINVDKEDFDYYLSIGYKKYMRPHKTRMTNDGKNYKMILDSEVDSYLNNGYVLWKNRNQKQTFTED